MRRARESPQTGEGFEGAVAGLGLADIIQLNGLNRFCGCVSVNCDSNDGLIFFRDGQIIHAEAGEEIGEAAFYRIMQWPGGKFSLQPNVTTAVRSIERNWEYLLMEACRLLDESRRAGTVRSDRQGAHSTGSKRSPAAGGGRRRVSALVVGLATGTFVLVAGGGVAFVMMTRQSTSADTMAGTAAGLATGTGRPGASLDPNVQVLLRLSGSDGGNAQLAPVLASAYLASLRVADTRTTNLSDSDVAVQGTVDGTPSAITVAARGTASGFEELLAGSADIAIAARRVKNEERQKLAGLGSMTSAANEHVLALDGVAVIVNMANSIAQLRRHQLASIFGGAVSDWSMLGVASDAQIEWSSVGVGGNKGGTIASGVHVYTPDDRSGIAEVFQSQVLGTMPFAPEVKRLPTFQAVTDAVVGDPGGVGFVPLAYVLGAKAMPIADADDPPLMPTPFTVATEEYLLTHRIYLYTAQASTNPHVSRFVQFALSPEGQAVVKKAGIVELSIKAVQKNVPSGAPAEYVKLTARARRLSTTIQFEGNSASLDNRALRDIERIVDYVRDNDLNGADVRVLGFSDNQGPKARAAKVSRDRAALVATTLAQRSVAGVTVAGMGSAMPIADNSNEKGRQRNRRVEVWIHDK